MGKMASQISPMYSSQSSPFQTLLPLPLRRESLYLLALYILCFIPNLTDGLMMQVQEEDDDDDGVVVVACACPCVCVVTKRVVAAATANSPECHVV